LRLLLLLLPQLQVTVCESGLLVGAGVTLTQLQELLLAQVAEKPQHMTRGFAAAAEQLRWFAGEAYAQQWARVIVAPPVMYMCIQVFRCGCSHIHAHTTVCPPSLYPRHYVCIVMCGICCAGRQIRNTGTLGGNIATASPISDLNPIWMAAGATFTVVSAKCGERDVPASQFFLGYRCGIWEGDSLKLGGWRL
jgi:FAD binding domain in molybdopterin dehydrogenase